MMRTIVVLALTVAIVALPLMLRREEPLDDWREGDPVLVVITPHNEAVRREFGRAFSAWHHRVHGRPVKVDWRSIGGASEIARYLEGEFVASFRAHWLNQNGLWPVDGADVVLDKRYDGEMPTGLAAAARDEWQARAALRRAFLATDRADACSSGIDVLFGGGTYDFDKAEKCGFLVPAWPGGAAPPGIFVTADGVELIPRSVHGEDWRTDTYYGTALSTFGICYNVDRLAELGLTDPPTTWRSLADPRLVGQVGVADPTKSGSNAKAIEVLIQETCRRTVLAAGFSGRDIGHFEYLTRQAGLSPTAVPPAVPPAYQTAVEQGWVEGVNLVRLIGANARYFTISAGKVPIDVSAGDAAAGLVIGFYARFQADNTRAPDGRPRMVFVNPAGGTSVSADPVARLRGAAHPALAVRFIEFTLGDDGQRLLAYRPGTPGGPERYALRRLPIRRDFYPSEEPTLQRTFAERKPYLTDPLWQPDVDAYALAAQFFYNHRWTVQHFTVQRHLVKAMCLDAGEELRAAWRAIIAAGGPAENPEAMAELLRLPDRPEPLTWRSVLDIHRRHATIDYMREWTLFFRETYDRARRLAERKGSRP